MKLCFRTYSLISQYPMELFLSQHQAARLRTQRTGGGMRSTECREEWKEGRGVDAELIDSMYHFSDVRVA